MFSISIIIPIFNVDTFLKRCVESVLLQSYTDFEVLLVDDGSNDDCGRISDFFSQMDCRVSVIHKVNGGLSDARNIGLEYVFTNKSINWITFIDSDDWIHHKYLETLYRAAVENHCDIASCMFEETSGVVSLENDKDIIVKITNPEDYFCEYNVYATIACAKIYKKELFSEIRYPYGRIHEDEFTTYKILYSTNRIVVVFSPPMYFYYINLNGITKQEWSPKRLDSVEAISNQLYFFRTKGFKASFIFSLGHLIDSIMHQYSVIPKVSANEKYLRILRKKLRQHLKLCRSYNVFLFRNNRHIYEIAYPIFMRYYWRYQVAKSKIGGK